MIFFISVDEHHEVRVLLDRARLPQVGQDRLLVARALLDVPAELGEGDHRHLELPGEALQRAADLADLLADHEAMREALEDAARTLHRIDHIEDRHIVGMAGARRVLSALQKAAHQGEKRARAALHSESETT